MQLKEYLELYGMSQYRLAKSLVVSTTHLNLLVNKKRLPSIYLARKIEKATSGKVTVCDLFDIEQPEPQKIKQ